MTVTPPTSLERAGEGVDNQPQQLGEPASLGEGEQWVRQRIDQLERFLAAQFPGSWEAARDLVADEWRRSRRLRPSGQRGVSGTTRPLPDRAA